MTGCFFQVVALAAFLLWGSQGQARSALFERTSASYEQPRRDNKVTLAGSVGFPGFTGIAVSYWPLGWLSVECLLEYGMAWFGTAGPAFHVPIFAHGTYRHDFIAIARAGGLTWGEAVYPYKGIYWSVEAGYGYLAKNLDVRLIMGLNVAYDPAEPDHIWGGKPTLGLRVGWAV